MSIFFIVIISFIISLTWLHYFRKIDLFEKEKLIHISVTFVLGTLFPFSIFFIDDYIFQPLGISESPNPVYNFLYYVFGVGLLEEIIKFIPVLITIYVFKKAVNEPLDYVKYICISALGFAFGENIGYALHYGGHVLLTRAILTVPAHMFFSSIFIYGLIEYRYDQKRIGVMFLYMLISAFSHGLYDFLLVIQVPFFSSFVHALFFMVLISVFVNILNNCLNTSPFYNSKLVIDQSEIRKYLLGFYFAIICSILVYTGVQEGVRLALRSYVWLMFWQSSILLVLIVRLSRFSIVPNLKNQLRIKFPFYLKRNPTSKDFRLFFGFFTIRGESYNEARVSKLFNEEIKVIPLNVRKSYLKQTYLGVIEKKVYENERIYFLLKIYLDASKLTFKHFVVIPKTEGLTHNSLGDPILSLNGITNDNKNKLDFYEWVVLKNNDLHA